MNAVPKPAVVESPLLLDVSDLHVSYGKINAVTGVSLRVRQGEIVTVVGPNGAGKTTLMSAIMGVLPSSGRIVVADEAGVDRDEGRGIASRVRSGIGLVPETRALFSSMSIEDNLRLGAFRFRKEPKARHVDALEEVFTLFPRLKERRQQEASTLSGGERQMLALGRALMGRPRLLMLDEPSLGLAPLIVREIFRILTRLREQGVSILLVEQNALAALKIADHAYVLELGQVAMEGPADVVAADPRVVQAYLGSQAKHQAMLSS
ncbi:ABC transporter ATP-binding protein [Curvibacter gracilis]|uniref:ABC transporter ATP-binding protein n=1 Tax=Curvibacter gracilis TaxID=230310 RepID=UPI0004B2B3EC|nr:ABC transporter ATP-binding protein [Curvibacter gracilis]